MAQDPTTAPLRKVALILASFAITGTLLDSTGLVGWARRMDVGPAQDFWLGLLEPLDASLGSLTVPRQELVALGESLQRGGDESTLSSVAWDPSVTADSPPEAPATPAPPADTAVKDTPSTPTTIVPSAPETVPTTAPEPTPDSAPKSVLLIGDSLMGVGILPALTRLAPDDPVLARIKLIPAHRNASGLARPDNYDWSQVFADLAKKYSPAFVVCALGGNDAQHFRHEGEILRFGTEAWDEVYTSRLENLLTAASAHSKVLLLGLPVMRWSKFDDQMKRINGLMKNVAASLPNVTFLEVNPVLAAEDGTYATWLPDSAGKLERVRTEDGIHYGGAGGVRVARLVIAWLETQLR
jgi:hypothetical protein